MPAITESSGVAITVLADNHAAYGLDAEHGFSLWVETEGQKILFDTGQGEDMPRNAEALGIDIGAADRILLSHGHFDHTGNVPYALERAKRASLLLHPDALIDRYSIHAAPKPIGMPEKSRVAVYASAGTRCQWVRRPRAVSAGVWITGPVPRVTDFEESVAVELHPDLVFTIALAPRDVGEVRPRHDLELIGILPVQHDRVDHVLEALPRGVDHSPHALSVGHPRGLNQRRQLLHSSHPPALVCVVRRFQYNRPTRYVKPSGEFPGVSPWPPGFRCRSRAATGRPRGGYGG